MKNVMRCIPVIVLLTISGCSDFLFFGESGSSSSEISEMDLREVAIAINNEVGEAKARNVEHCSILPIGAKPCGGPWGYLVYSNQTSDKSTLTRLLERYDKLDEIRNTEEGRFSTCDVATPPEVILENGVCKGLGPYAWNRDTILERNGIE